MDNVEIQIKVEINLPVVVDFKNSACDNTREIKSLFEV